MALDRELRTKINLSAVILTYNEEANLDVCLRSVYDWAENICIIDSYSTDKTLDIARKYTNHIYQHFFENQSKQVNWALENIPYETEWIMRLDADETVTPALKDELFRKLPGLDQDITGLYVKRKVYFMRRWIRYGGYYPTWLLRMWRNGKGYCENKRMDEHISITEGKTMFLENDIVDDNRNNLSWWIKKHNRYATREAIDLLNLKYCPTNNEGVQSKLSGTQEQRKRWLKENVYANMPLFVRPLLYFTYRYFIRLGFLDGKEGLIWHFLQGFWYRFLVDAKIYEIYKRAGKDRENLRTLIKNEYGIDL